MKVNDNYMWIPILALLVGFGLPVFVLGKVVVEVSEYNINMWIFMCLSTLMFSGVAFSKIGRKYPRLANWGQDTLTGITTATFLFGLLTTTLAGLFVMLLTIPPFPEWLHKTVAIGIFLYAVVLVYKHYNT